MPHDQLGKVSRYVGADGRAPALSKLGGKAWQTLRSRARVAVHELAGELLALYAAAADADARVAHRTRRAGWSGSSGRSPTRRPRIRRARSTAVKEDLESSSRWTA